MKVTRTLIADVPTGLAPVCKAMGFLRGDIWRRYGSLQNAGRSAQDIRLEISAGGRASRGIERAIYVDAAGKTRKVAMKGCGLYDALPVDGTIRGETMKDVVNDILTYKEAAKLKVKKDIWKRTDDPVERKRLFTLMKADKWLEDSFLHRRMRKHFKHGVSHASNQFVVRSDRHSSEVVDGRLVVTIRCARKFGEDIKLVTTSTGKNVDLTKSNLRIITKDGFSEIHYATDKGIGNAAGSQAIGVDKGYTEAFTDSDGDAHGETFGKVLTGFSDKTSKTGKARSRLHAIEKKHREAGRIAKADRILRNNLGRKKIDSRRDTTQKQLRGIAFKSAHSIVDKAGIVVSEDLTSPIAAKQQWKQFNRRMSGWAKGVLAEALDSVCAQRGAEHALVNGAYTSQMDSFTGLLKGKRSGDKFYRENGDVLQADHNAAMNVLERLGDSEITRYMPYKEVRRILLARSPAELTVTRLELESDDLQPSADKSKTSQVTVGSVL